MSPKNIAENPNGWYNIPNIKLNIKVIRFINFIWFI